MEIKGSSSTNSIKYVDVREGSSEAFVRFDSCESAKSFTQMIREDRTMTILEGKHFSIVTVALKQKHYLTKYR